MVSQLKRRKIKMGIDGSCKVRLIRKNKGNAVEEFKSLKEIVDSINSVVGCLSVECVVNPKCVELRIENSDDRSFFYERYIVPTMLKGEKVKSFENLTCVQKGESWDERKYDLCKKYDCWMVSRAQYDSAASQDQYYVIDNTSKTLIDTTVSLFDYSYAEMEPLSQPWLTEEMVKDAKVSVAKFKRDIETGEALIAKEFD